MNEGLVLVLLSPFLQVDEASREVDHIDVAPAEVAQIISVRLLLDIADAILRDDRSKAVAEAIDRGGSDAAGRIAACYDYGIHPLLDKVSADTRFEED